MSKAEAIAKWESKMAAPMGHVLAPEPQSKKAGKELNRVQGGVPVSMKVFGGKLWRQNRRVKR